MDFWSLLYLDSSIVISSSSSSLLDWLLSIGSFTRLWEILLCLTNLRPDLCFCSDPATLSGSLSEFSSCCLTLAGIFRSFFGVAVEWGLSERFSVWGSTLFLCEEHRCHLDESSKYRKQELTGGRESRLSEIRNVDANFKVLDRIFYLQKYFKNLILKLFYNYIF